MQNNGSLYLHLYLVKSGTPLSSFRNSEMNENYRFISSLETKIIHRARRLNSYKKKRGDLFNELHSHWHPNLTVNLVHNSDSSYNLGFVFDNLDFVDTFPIFFNDQ